MITGCSLSGRLQDNSSGGDPDSKAVNVQAQEIAGESFQKATGRAKLGPGRYRITHRDVMETHGGVNEAPQEVPAWADFRKPLLLEILMGLDVPARLP